MSDPSDGPIAAASAPTAPQRATALARRAAGKALSTHERERRTQEERGAEGLERAGRDQHAGRGCHAAERGGGAEEAEAEQAPRAWSAGRCACGRRDRRSVRPARAAPRTRWCTR